MNKIKKTWKQEQNKVSQKKLNFNAYHPKLAKARNILYFGASNVVKTCLLWFVGCIPIEGYYQYWVPNEFNLIYQTGKLKRIPSGIKVAIQKKIYCDDKMLGAIGCFTAIWIFVFIVLPFLKSNHIWSWNTFKKKHPDMFKTN